MVWGASELLVKPNPAPENSHHPFTIALTGGIASGKTLVSDEFSRLGVPVIDTDVIAHKLVERGQPALQEIKDVFGPKFIGVNGQLKRSNLRTLIFSNPTARKKLESILHPKIKGEVNRIITELITNYCILVIPLLTDRANYPNVNRILVVDVKPEVQIMRLMARDNCNRKQAEQALAAQISRAQRLKIADDILENSSSPARVCAIVASLHEKYLNMSAQAVLKEDGT